jgi:hypothetical protein
MTSDNGEPDRAEIAHDLAGGLMDEYGSMRDRRDVIVMAGHEAGYRPTEIGRRMHIHSRTVRGIIARNAVPAHEPAMD